MQSGKNRIYNVKKPYGYFIFVIVNTVKVFSAVQINYKVTDKVNNAFIGNIGIILGLQPVSARVSFATLPIVRALSFLANGFISQPIL